MPKIVRHPPGKDRPRNAPMATLPLRGLGRRIRRVYLRHWHCLTVRWEARQDTTRSKKWRRWVSYTNATRVVWAVAALAVLAWAAEAVYISVAGGSNWFEHWRKSPGFDGIVRVVGPVLTASLAAALFLFWWYSWTKRRYLKKARRVPRELVVTAGPDTAEIVGREEVAQVITQRLRERDTRRPYLLVGGVGVGKTAVLVRLTEMLAEQGAVPVPIRLRDATGPDLDFERMAQKRFAEAAPRGVLARTKTDRVWQQLLADDKVVVLADGLEEAVLDEGVRQDRDNIIRRAIERAHEERLPLVIASRPHSPLESTPAAIVELEPLSEEEALDFVEARVPETDERRVDWIVETAEVTESPIYLQIARELHQHGDLERDRRNDPRRLDSRSTDRSQLRLWLLETWGNSLLEGRLRTEEPLGERERQDTLEVVSALACVGLLQDTLEVGFTELVDNDVHPGRARRVRAHAGHLWEQRGWDPSGKRGGAFSQWHRHQIWKLLCDGRGEVSRRLREGNLSQGYDVLAHYASHADRLKLVEGFDQKVRFPHSILQAYFGYRTLYRLGERDAGELVEQALRPPGPGRELLIALVLLSRRWAADRSAKGGAVTAGQRKRAEGDRRRAPVPGRSLAHRLLIAANRRSPDPKALDLYTAALEIECVEDDPRLLHAIVRTVHRRWRVFKGDKRTLEEAKLGLLRQLGTALRATSGRIDTTPLYQELFEMGKEEPAYSIRLAAAQEFGSGGNDAFAVVRRWINKHTDPVREYNDRVSGLKDSRRRLCEVWAADMQRVRAAAIAPQDRDRLVTQLTRRRESFDQQYQRERDVLLREFVMRAWMIPMLLGSVEDNHRDEARERLTKWLWHLDPRSTGGTPDLPLALEAALAQGFKYAANRRRRHPDTYPGARADLIRQAETVLQQSRCWYAQLNLLQALCLWELPDSGKHREQGGRTGNGHERDGEPPGEASGAVRGLTAVQTVERWLSMAGTVNHAAARAGADGTATRGRLHPFVAETGDLVALALETRRPERFVWIDEKGAADNIGSRTAPRGYRKHHLWIPPSAGWRTLDGRAQRLIADVLVMLNLIERDGHPEGVEERLERVEQPGMPLPPCIRRDRRALWPGMKAGTSRPPTPGATCLPDCKFQLCPYPPRGCVPRGEISEPFCRQQQALLPGRLRRRLPRGVATLHRKTPAWVGMRVGDLDRFWGEMAGRTRG
ncbi:ATP-binding protein [Streptomyces sp. NPDC046759]|uniref:ATP-binding protein n=1 Tax=Streptomyces sp. NPDC046759 TaxID=3155019 RepID=UPI00340F8ED2